MFLLFLLLLLVLVGLSITVLLGAAFLVATFPKIAALIVLVIFFLWLFG